MSELIRREEVQHLIASTDEVSAYAFKILDERLAEIPTVAVERDCNGCMGAAFNDCDQCDKIIITE